MYTYARNINPQQMIIQTLSVLFYWFFIGMVRAVQPFSRLSFIVETVVTDLHRDSIRNLYKLHWGKTLFITFYNYLVFKYGNNIKPMRDILIIKIYYYLYLALYSSIVIIY